MIDLMVVSMGDAWGAEMLTRNLNNSGVSSGLINVMAFINGPVEQCWVDAVGDGCIMSDLSNHGFPVAANELIHAGKNEELILVDDDVAFPQGWVARLIEARKAVVKAGLPVGLGGIPLDAWKPEELGMLTMVGGIQIRPRSTPIGGCRHLGRETVEEMGYICEGYFPCGGDDVDYCNRLSWAGKYNYHIEAVRSTHEHHERDAAYKQAKAEALLRIADVDAKQQFGYRRGQFKYTPQREWLFT